MVDIFCNDLKGHFKAIQYCIAQIVTAWYGPFDADTTQN